MSDKGCEFCRGKEEKGSGLFYIKVSGKTLETEILDNGYLQLNDKARFKIEFCPMCGTKLSEVEK